MPIAVYYLAPTINRKTGELEYRQSPETMRTFEVNAAKTLIRLLPVDVLEKLATIQSAIRATRSRSEANELAMQQGIFYEELRTLYLPKMGFRRHDSDRVLFRRALSRAVAFQISGRVSFDLPFEVRNDNR
jgi:hypothetical protein